MPKKPTAGQATNAHSERDRSDEDAIRRRAHEISLSEDTGTAEENWLRAERELHPPKRPRTPRKTKPA